MEAGIHFEPDFPSPQMAGKHPIELLSQYPEQYLYQTTGKDDVVVGCTHGEYEPRICGTTLNHPLLCLKFFFTVA